jgi:tRNA (cytidine/uridine-2'-O-)-methyltransferase
MRLAVFQPDIAPNLGAIVRTCACLGVPVDVIEPCGFPFSVKSYRRAAMDYADLADITRHDDWDAFQASRSGRLVLMTTRGAVPLAEFEFQQTDTILMGRESAGVPDFVHDAADALVVIPTAPGTRSLNISVSAGIAVWAGLQNSL